MATTQKALYYSSDKRSLYVGRLERILSRMNVASTLLLSTDKPLDIVDQTTGKIHHCKSLLIPAGMNVTIDTHNANVAVCFLDDLGTDLNRLIPKMSDSINISGQSHCFSNIRCESDMIKSVGNLLATRPSAEDALDELDSWMTFVNTSVQNLPDVRVSKAVSMIKDNYSQNISVAEVADSVHLSVPRLSQLFKEVTGTPIRRFRLWHRISMTAIKLREGLSLTDAAIFSGFSDYAQFSRVYRELCGGSPAAAKNNTEIKILSY